MSKREAKGQRVKSFKCFVPQPDLSTVPEQIVVYLKADDGRFSIYQGEHMLEACRQEAQKRFDTRVLLFREDSISCSDLNELVEGFHSLCQVYIALLREEKKDRVIRFRFKRNLEGTPGKMCIDDISFCGAPAVHFSHEVLWRVREKLFRQADPKCPLQFAGLVQDRFDEGPYQIVEWTQERQDFFENMERSLVTLIARIEDFQANLQRNVDLAIAGQTTPLLPAPAKENA